MAIARAKASSYVWSTAPPNAMVKSVANAPLIALSVNRLLIRVGLRSFNSFLPIAPMVALVAALPYIPPTSKGTTSSINSNAINSDAKVSG